MKSSPNVSGPVCGGKLIIRSALVFLLSFCAAPGYAQTDAKAPLVVLLDGDAKQWEGWCQQAGWLFLAVGNNTAGNIDERIKTLEAQIKGIKGPKPVDENRVYLTGQGEGAATVFYVAARLPDLWAAAVAIGGTPRPAIDSNRLFASNTTNLPVLWITGSKEDEVLAGKLKSAGYNLEFRSDPNVNAGEVFKWLGTQKKEAFPSAVDCETSSPAFSRCYWIDMTKFDPSLRNDVLKSSRVEPGSGATLDLGGFGFNPAAPGPGVVVAWLPENYQGPLKLNDRIAAIGGKELPDARAYVDLMEKTFEEKPASIMVERGKERVRIETRIVLPKRQETVTARVQGRYLPDTAELQIISRAVSQMKVEIPNAWTPVTIWWNGSSLEKAETGGCWVLKEEKALPGASKCAP